MKCANENGYRVIRVLQKEVADESFDFDKLVNKIISDNQCNMFICGNNEYCKFNNLDYL